MKYTTLLNVLDKIRAEAPETYRSYNPDPTNEEEVNHARSKALIHLYLKVKYGLTDFAERHHFIPDGTNDGGIDGYYIDGANKEVVIVQSKFRTNPDNFEEKEITYEELLKMDVNRIVEGEQINEAGIEYNGKIKQLMRDIAEIPDPGRWNYKIVLLANIKESRVQAINRITDGYQTEIFNYEKVYNELLYPVIAGSYYNASELNITINVSNKNESIISYDVDTEVESCEIKVCFVPTLEIAKIINKYKNSILKFNPRSYLDLSNNSVNPEIRSTIIGKTTNEFALFNNGITILSDESAYSTRSGRRGAATLTLKCPQIINGGQTAFTLGRIYEECLAGDISENVFDDKEVILKVISFDPDLALDEEKKRNLIEAISKATNQQTFVSDADRRSNDSCLIKLQGYIYKKHGLFLERKLGEFGDGVHNKYISRASIIDRITFMRIAMAVNGLVYQTKTGDVRIYTVGNIVRYFELDNNNINKYVYAYRFLETLNRYDPNNTVEYGYSLKYGRYAIVYAASLCFDESWKSSDYDDIAQRESAKILMIWREFEEYAKKQEANNYYFNDEVFNIMNYYKSRNLNQDLENYFRHLAPDEGAMQGLVQQSLFN